MDAIKERDIARGEKLNKKELVDIITDALEGAEQEHDFDYGTLKEALEAVKLNYYIVFFDKKTNEGAAQ